MSASDVPGATRPEVRSRGTSATSPAGCASTARPSASALRLMVDGERLRPAPASAPRVSPRPSQPQLPRSASIFASSFALRAWPTSSASRRSAATSSARLSRLARHGITFALLRHGNRVGKRFECAPNASAARADRVDPAKTVTMSMRRRHVGVLSFELTHQCEKLRVTVGGHRLQYCGRLDLHSRRHEILSPRNLACEETSAPDPARRHRRRTPISGARRSRCSSSTAPPR